MSTPVSVDALRGYADALLQKVGLEPAKASVVAEILVEGDLLGHTTHGLALLPAYLAELERGGMANTGEPIVLADAPSAVTWDGRRLPGAWLTARAIDLAIARAHDAGTCTVVIRRSHHIGCLAAYLRRATDRNLAIVLTCSDPNNHSVAPHGGRVGVFTPNPIAAGWPTRGEPVLLDVSMSIATNALTGRLRAEGARFPGLWAVDAAGRPTNDPEALYAEPPGALLPIGGLDHGHKGSALALLVEMLTGGLSGRGRADASEGWTSNTFVQVFDPARFGGLDDFTRQTEHVAQACRTTPPREGVDHVRLPGQIALRRRAEQLAHGLDLHPTILPALRPWAEKLGVQPL